MLRFQDITEGVFIKGLDSNNLVRINSVKFLGTSSVKISFTDNKENQTSRIIYENDLENLEALHLPDFTADGNTLRLAAEAYRLSIAHVIDPYLAVRSSNIEPLPHQISAVYQEMLQRMPLRFVLADDPGAGKTIMTGLFLKELLLRGALTHCLIVTPGSLAEQWQDELSSKFSLDFTILTQDSKADLYIARLDKLARDKTLQSKIQNVHWDVVVVDEAHKMSASVSGRKITYTKRFHLGQLLSGITNHFLLLTATPHNGKPKEFQLFMSLIDPERYAGALNTTTQPDTSDVMRRILKEDLKKFDGTPLFPERIACTVKYSLADDEAKLYQEVTDYVRNEFNRADKLKAKRRNTVGFALTILQRRLASSPEAIRLSLTRRRETLEQRLRLQQDYQVLDDEYDSEVDSTPELTEDYAVNYVSASQNSQELAAEIQTLRRLEEHAELAANSRDDRKWHELSQLLQNNPDEKLIIFTEHKDTLNYLAGQIRTLLGRPDDVVTIHGSMRLSDRKESERLFTAQDGAKILIATDAAGEGINLQAAHLMINYDIPWNPNRLEQRFGRIHRIGQHKVCYLWNLVSEDTREGAVLSNLVAKLEEAKHALGGKVFDVLGNITFNGKSLSELMIEAVRNGDDSETIRRITRTVDNSLKTEKLLQLLDSHGLVTYSVDPALIRSQTAHADIHKLQPFYVQPFFVEAFNHLGGSINNRGSGLFELSTIPEELRTRDSRIPRSCERVCFSKDFSDSAELISPGHPLLNAVISGRLHRHSAPSGTE